MTVKINTLENGMKVDIPLLITNVARGVTQNGAPYLSITFQDDTGTIEGKWWDVKPFDEANVKQGSIGVATVDTLLYRNSLQLRVHAMDFSGTYSINDFVLGSQYETEFLKEEIEKFISMIESSVYRSLVRACFEAYGEDFYSYPAATRNHHDFVGGLATHVYGMCQLAVELCKLYPILNRDLLLSGVLVHDMGKIEEYTAPMLSEYTPQGKLLGHISIIQAKIYEIACELGLRDTEEVMLLRHLILSHHGQYEYGSPVLPLVKEAEILNFIDNIDARMNMLDKIYSGLDEGQFAPRAFALENRSFYKGKGVK